MSFPHSERLFATCLNLSTQDSTQVTTDKTKQTTATPLAARTTPPLPLAAETTAATTEVYTAAAVTTDAATTGASASGNTTAGNASADSSSTTGAVTASAATASAVTTGDASAGAVTTGDASADNASAGTTAMQQYAANMAQLDREALATVSAALLLTLAFWAVIYCTHDSSLSFFNLPWWFILSCGGGYLLSIGVVLVLTKKFMRHLPLKVTPVLHSSDEKSDDVSVTIAPTIADEVLPHIPAAPTVHTVPSSSRSSRSLDKK